MLRLPAGWLRCRLRRIIPRHNITATINSTTSNEPTTIAKMNLNLCSGSRLGELSSPSTSLKEQSNKVNSEVINIIVIINNGNRTEWSPIWSVIIRVITKSDDREAGVRFVNHKYDYRLNWTTRCPVTN